MAFSSEVMNIHNWVMLRKKGIKDKNKRDVFVKNLYPRNGHFFENWDLDIWP